MAHVFDSGLSRSTRRLIREAVAEKLTGLSRADGMYFQAVIQLPAPFQPSNDDLMYMLADSLGGRSPAVAVALGRRSFTAGGGGSEEHVAELQVHVYVMSQHGGGMLPRQAGDGAADLSLSVDPGLDTALEHVFERLAGTDLGLASGVASELVPQEEDVVFFGQDYCIWEQVYKCTVQADVNPLRDGTPLATEIETNYFRDGFDNETPAVTTLTELDP